VCPCEGAPGVSMVLKKVYQVCVCVGMVSWSQTRRTFFSVPASAINCTTTWAFCAGLLRNTDEGMPITPIDAADMSDAPLPDLRPPSFSSVDSEEEVCIGVCLFLCRLTYMC
jgi:hypothetical protein